MVSEAVRGSVSNDSVIAKQFKSDQKEKYQRKWNKLKKFAERRNSNYNQTDVARICLSKSLNIIHKSAFFMFVAIEILPSINEACRYDFTIMLASEAKRALKHGMSKSGAYGVAKALEQTFQRHPQPWIGYASPVTDSINEICTEVGNSPIYRDLSPFPDNSDARAVRPRLPSPAGEQPTQSPNTRELLQTTIDLDKLPLEIRIQMYVNHIKTASGPLNGRRAEFNFEPAKLHQVQSHLKGFLLALKKDDQLDAYDEVYNFSPEARDEVKKLDTEISILSNMRKSFKFFNFDINLSLGSKLEQRLITDDYKMELSKLFDYQEDFYIPLNYLRSVSLGERKKILR